MTLSKSLLVAFALLAVTLSGCTSEDDGGAHGFIVKTTPSDPVTEPFVFQAKVSGDSYSWDMGDGRAKQTGKEVTYTYGFTDGVIKPKLTVMRGEDEQTYTARAITLGTGENQDPTLAMSVEWAWVTAGEPVTISGAGSTDPDGDPMLFSWFCQRESDIGIPNDGGHDDGGGVGFGSAGVKTIPATFLNGTDVPAADTEVTGDFCAELTSRNNEFTENATLRGAFAEPGIYKVTMLAKDPKTPSAPGGAVIYVTPTNMPRVTGPVTIDFSGEFQAGVPAALDEAATAANNGEQPDHIRDHSFLVTYPLLGFQLDFDFESTPAVEEAVTYHIMKPNGSPKDTAESSEDLDKGIKYLTHSNSAHELRVYGRAGTSLSYDATLTLNYQTDPSKIFENPAGH